MTLEEKFNRLASMVGDLTETLQQLRQENQVLQQETEQLHRENDGLKQELTSLRGECHKLKLEAADRTALVTSKLSGVLQRLEELERLEG